MKVSEKQMVSTRALTVLPTNPRKITQADLNRLCDSIRQNGFWPHRPLGVERQGDQLIVLDGNQRLKAVRRLKWKEVPCVIYEDLTDEERDQIILRSNINNGSWDLDKLQVEFEDVDFEDLGLQFELPEMTVEPEVNTKQTPVAQDSEEVEEPPTEEEGNERVAKESLWDRMLGDYLYPTDNEYEIPLLLDDYQPVHLELPFTPWGVEGRYKKGITTYHFYVDDYRFEKLYKNPRLLLESGCRAVVEPNNSIHDQTPVAYAIYQIYRKRYLARYLQECGLQVWVDLNVSHRFMDLNLMGVPKGYNAFFTRGVAGWENHLDLCLQKAQEVSGKEKPNMYVYGGGKEIEKWCQEHGIRYLDEHMNHRMKEKGLK